MKKFYFLILVWLVIVFSVHGYNSAYADSFDPSHDHIGYVDHIIALDRFPVLRLRQTGNAILVGVENSAFNIDIRKIKKAEEYLIEKGLGREVLVAPIGPPDIFQRIPVRIKPLDQNWLHEELIGQGLVRVQASRYYKYELADLFKIEAVAHEKQKGLWGTGEFQVFNANQYEGPSTGFQIAMGEIQKITESRHYLYINFGDNWRKDFTVGVSKLVMHEEVRQIKKQYEIGDVVEIRGLVRSWNGPFLELYDLQHFRKIGLNDMRESY